MSDASEWIVVPAHREFPSTSQFVPVESSHAGFALARLGAILRVGGGILRERGAASAVASAMPASRSPYRFVGKAKRKFQSRITLPSHRSANRHAAL